MGLEVLTSLSEWKSYRKSIGHSRIGFVPTMGALHVGHLSLVELAGNRTEAVGVSIFVNPTQFLPGEDFERYPRTFESDLQALESTCCQWVLAPDRRELYPPGDDWSVDPGVIGTVLEGAVRPGHFKGVATIVFKLLSLTSPDVAVFGRKDAQQCAVIQQMIDRFHFPVEIVIGNTFREVDGLAYSSRNRYLSVSQRVRAVGLVQALRTGITSLHEGKDGETAIQSMFDCLNKFSPDAIDYLTFVDERTFLSSTDLRCCRAVGAVRFGTTRLIDTLSLEETRLLL